MMSPRTRNIVIAAVVSVIVLTAVLVPVLVLVVFKPLPNVESVPMQIPANMTLQKLMLSLGNPFGNNDTWAITKYYYGQENVETIDNETFRVKFKQGSFNPSSPVPGGFLFYATPSSFPAQEVYFKYSVNFGENFDWVKGGMLPGLWIGQMGAYDGNHLTNGSSLRTMWRGKGQAEAYMYVGDQVPDFYKLPGFVSNAMYGESVGRGFSSFKQGVWNNITMHVKLNTVGQSDGVLQLAVNDKTFVFDKMIWRTEENTTINGLMMNSFFGGSDVTWATPFEQAVLFSKFEIFT